MQNTFISQTMLLLPFMQLQDYAECFILPSFVSAVREPTMTNTKMYRTWSNVRELYRNTSSPLPNLSVNS